MHFYRLMNKDFITPIGVLFAGGLLLTGIALFIASRDRERAPSQTPFNVNASDGPSVNADTSNVSPESNKGLHGVVDLSTWQTYRHEELGFEVKLPTRWSEYRIEVTSRGGGLGSVGFAKQVEYIHAITGEKRLDYYTVMAITVMSEAEWQAELSMDQPHPGYFTTKAGRAYTYGIGQDNAEQDYLDVLEVLKTFQTVE